MEPMPQRLALLPNLSVRVVHAAVLATILFNLPGVQLSAQESAIAGGSASPFQGAQRGDLSALLDALPAAQEAWTSESSGPRAWESKVALYARGEMTGQEPAALCSVRLQEGSSKLAVFCRHELGSEGLVSLVRAGADSRSEPPLWTAPLASPFAATAELSPEALGVLLGGELAIRIDTGIAGVVVEGVVDIPIFDSGFDFNSLCEWSNYPCPSDGNVCTYDYCSSTGTCSYINQSVSCSLANASGICNSGNCVISSCNSGYSNCDGLNANGCEVNHNSGAGACSNLVNFVASYPGDQVCGIICPNNIFNVYTFATRTGRGEAFYSAEAQEKSSCLGDTEHIIELAVPDGVDYDLYVYRNCQLVEVSNNATGVDERVFLSEPENALGSESFYYQVEVRWFSGRSCSNWTLSFTGHPCS